MPVNAVNASQIRRKRSIWNAALLGGVRVAFAVLNAVSNRFSAKLAQRLYTKPPRILPKPGTEDTKFLQTAQRFSIAYLDMPLDGYCWQGRGEHKVLLVHGWGAHPVGMVPLARRLLAAGYTVYAYEAPAHGRHPAQRSSPMQWADSVCAAMAAIGQVSAIVGHSVGAGAVLIAARKQLATRCMVLISPLTCIIEATDYFAEQVGVGRKAIRTMRDFAWQHAEPSGSRYARNWEGLFRSPYLAPTLIVHDQDDVVIPISHSKRLSQQWPQATFIQTQGLGHARILKDEAVQDSLLQFIEDQLTESALTGSALVGNPLHEQNAGMAKVRA